MIFNKPKWGWLRLALGFGQMGLVAAAVASYLHVGFDTITLLVISATVILIQDSANTQALGRFSRANVAYNGATKAAI
jgi:hypothetical protein